jgi:hypothetical protein
MNGFPQWFFCPTTILRAGPEAKKYGDKWVYAVVVSFPWIQILRRCLGLQARATVWALSSDGNLKINHVRPLFHWVRGLNFEPQWERFNHLMQKEISMSQVIKGSVHHYRYNPTDANGVVQPLADNVFPQWSIQSGDASVVAAADGLTAAVTYGHTNGEVVVAADYTYPDGDKIPTATFAETVVDPEDTQATITKID